MRNFQANLTEETSIERERETIVFKNCEFHKIQKKKEKAELEDIL